MGVDASRLLPDPESEWARYTRLCGPMWCILGTLQVLGIVIAELQGGQLAKEQNSALMLPLWGFVLVLGLLSMSVLQPRGERLRGLAIGLTIVAVFALFAMVVYVIIVLAI